MENMKQTMPEDKNLNPIPVLPIGTAQDITDETIPAGESVLSVFRL